jgi:ribosomal protein S12 methylthiotransferase accessory factor
MEAIELHAAETADVISIRASYDELAGRYAMPAVENLPLRRWNLFSTRWALPWSLGWDLISQAEVPVPSALVGMSRRSALVTNVGAFHVTSNGLGAGNSTIEAITSALYEVIERDALACAYAAAAGGKTSISILSRSHLDSYPLVANVLNKCDRAEVQITVYDCTTDTRVPTYNALAHDNTDHGVGVVKGSGSHLDPEIAVLRAITEALQARLNFIAGSRDDVFRSAFSRSRADWNKAVQAITRERRESPKAKLSDSRANPSFEQDTHTLLERIQNIGLHQVVVFDITPESFPISVVRVIVPGLEGYQHHGFQPGPRAKAAAGRMSSP